MSRRHSYDTLKSNAHAHFLWWDAMLSINARLGKGLVLAQLNMLDFVDFPWKPLRIGKVGWGE